MTEPKFAYGERVQLTRTVLVDAGACPHCGQDCEEEKEVKTIHHVSKVQATYRRGGSAVYTYSLDGGVLHAVESELEAI